MKEFSDYTLPNVSTVVAGKTGTGKTTFVIRLLLNTPCAARFVFDDRGQVSHRLNLPMAATLAECERALASQWILFNPHPCFPGDTAGGFRWWCEWAYRVSKRGPGRKLFFVDEVWRHVNPNTIPKELAVVIQEGRSAGLQPITATQRPHRLNEAILGSASELVAFRLEHRKSLKAIEEMGGDPVRVKNLPLDGSFISFNLDAGTSLAGNLFRPRN